MRDIFDNIKAEKNAANIVSIAMILSHIGVEPDLDTLAQFVQVRMINQSILINLEYLKSSAPPEAGSVSALAPLCYRDAEYVLVRRRR